MSDSLKTLFQTAFGSNEIHASLLNTFSFLEYIGCRKIIKSQEAQSLSAAVLTHATEEARHALILKKMAVRLGGIKFDSYAPSALLCGSEAEAYFQLLDQGCASQLAPDFPHHTSQANYLYVTWLIEQRAIKVYKSYQKAQGIFGASSALNGLLEEEVHHLAAVEIQLRELDSKYDQRIESLGRLEVKLYHDLLASLIEQANLACIQA